MISLCLQILDVSHLISFNFYAMKFRKEKSGNELKLQFLVINLQPYTHIGVFNSAKLRTHIAKY